MGSVAVTTGTLFVRSCPEISRIIEELRDLVDGMDEHDVTCEPVDVKKYGPGILRIEINIYGHTSASTSTLIDEKIQEFGPYAVEASRFRSEWEGESSRLYVGNEAQVAKAESKDALDRIKQSARMLQGNDIGQALCHILQCSRQSSFKTQYFHASGGICPFYCDREVRKTKVEQKSVEPECPHCGKSLEHSPDQDDSCDWSCPHCGWSQHMPSERR